MDEKEVKAPLENRLFMVEKIGKEFVIREVMPHSNVVVFLGDYSSLCEFFGEM